MNDRRGTARLYDALLRLYPREFRDEYGADMSLLFRDQCADEPAVRVAARAVLDLALTLPEQHLEVHVRRSSPTVVSILYLGTAAAGLVLALVGGTNRTSLLLGLSLAMVGGVLGIAARRRAATVSTAPATGSWWKLLIAGSTLIGSVIVGAGLGIEAWYAGMVAVLLGLALSACGLALGIVRLVSRRQLPAG